MAHSFQLPVVVFLQIYFLKVTMTEVFQSLSRNNYVTLYHKNPNSDRPLLSSAVEPELKH